MKKYFFPKNETVIEAENFSEAKKNLEKKPEENFSEKKKNKKLTKKSKDVLTK